MIAVIDAREKKSEQVDFLSLSLWGKNAIFYPIEAVLKTHLFTETIVLTSDPYLSFLIDSFYQNKITLSGDEQILLESEICIINARAVMITSELIKEKYDEYINRRKFVSGVIKRKYDTWGCGDTYTKTPVICFGSVEHYNDCTDNQLFLVSDEDAVLLDSKNNFELTLVLLNKRNKSVWLKEKIFTRINEKKAVIGSRNLEPSN